MNKPKTRKKVRRNFSNKGNGADKNKRNDRREEEYDVKSPTNDPSWYAQTPELMQLAANIPFSQAAGTPFNLDITALENGNDMPDMTVPGIMTLSIIPCPSGAESPTAPLNIAATSIFSFVRHANSGTPQYNSPDLMLYCLSMGQVYAYINFLQRIYGCMNLYANMNRYLPRALVQAQNVNYDNVLQNLPNFKYGIDTLIHKAASLACPAAMTYFKRLAFMFSGVYAEGESIKDQLYMYVPAGFMQYSDTAETTGGSLALLPFTQNDGTPFTYSELIDYGNSLLDPILSSESMNIMSGDVLKAYGDSGILTLATMPDVYIIQPTTDLEVLEQFQNAQFPGAMPTTCKITQSQKGLSGSLITNIAFAKNDLMAGVLAGDKLLTTILTKPDAGNVMERTRLMLTLGSVNADNSFSVYGATEIPIALSIYTTVPPTLNTTPLIIGQTGAWAQDSGVDLIKTYIDVHCKLENFKFHPTIYYFEYGTDNQATLVNIAVDIDNYAIVSTTDLSRMNEAALLSMFNVNSVAKAY